MKAGIMAGTLVSFHDVSLETGGHYRVRGLNFEIREKETLVLLGRSGSGKTTTLKLMNRLLSPTHGEIFFDNQPLVQQDPIKLRRRIGYCIQEIGLFPHFTVEENVAVVPALLGWRDEKIKSRVAELLELVGLDPKTFRHRTQGELSGGQRQRVGVARALGADPPMILMDEPFGALDPITRSQLQKEFKSLAAHLQKTIVFVTHDLREAYFLADRIGLFQNGELILISSPNEFLRSQNPEAQSFVNSLQEISK